VIERIWPNRLSTPALDAQLPSKGKAGPLMGDRPNSEFISLTSPRRDAPEGRRPRKAR
jgi:hypothetical protein